MSRIQTQKSTDAQNNHIKERSQEGKGTGEEMTRKMRKKGGRRESRDNNEGVEGKKRGTKEE